MSRYIDADDVLELLDLMYDDQADKDDPYNVGVMGVTNYIKHRAPSIDIVRCRECRYWHSGECWGIPYRGDYDTSIDTRADDFCSYGVKKGADDE